MTPQSTQSATLEAWAIAFDSGSENPMSEPPRASAAEAMPSRISYNSSWPVTRT
jgi:hypothetical protein